MTGPSTLADIGAVLRSGVEGIVPAGIPWSMVDYPLHANCGDAAIWLGQYVVADWLGARVRVELDSANYRNRHLRRDSHIVLPGGGNFGGLYASHHRIKMALLTANKGRPIYQFPQSVEYGSPALREELRRAVSDHGAFVLMVRDQRSYDRAVADFDCPVHLLPDVALALGGLTPPRPPEFDLQVQHRADPESPAGFGPELLGRPGVDWLTPGDGDPRGPLLAELREHSRKLARTRLPPGRGWRRTARQLADANLDTGADLLSRGRFLVTDRLHGHVMAVLLGIPHVVVNDRYGKVQALWDTWTSRLPHGQFAGDWEQAAALVPR